MLYFDTGNFGPHGARPGNNSLSLSFIIPDIACHGHDLGPFSRDYSESPGSSIILWLCCFETKTVLRPEALSAESTAVAETFAPSKGLRRYHTRLALLHRTSGAGSRQAKDAVNLSPG